MEFTTSTIAKLSLPIGKSDAIFFDDELPCFGLRLRAGGKKVWVVQYRVRGRQRRETLGDNRKLTLKSARVAAQRRFAEIALGGDPQGDKVAARENAALTLGALADRYLAVRKPVVRKNTFIAAERYLTRYFKNLRPLPIADVNRRLVAARLAAIVSEHGMTAAARARQALSAFFTWTIKEGLSEINPVIGTNDPGEHLQARDRVLTEPEIRSIWRSCEDDDFGHIIKLLMFTATRRDEIGGLGWSEVDVDRAALHIPGTRTKNHHPLVLTLPQPAVVILKSKKRREGRDFIFGGGEGPFSAWGFFKLSMDARTVDDEGRRIPAWRIHDIRRTVATGMAELGIAPHIVETVLNHRGGHKGGVAGIYNRAKYENEVKRALALWADHLLSIVESTDRRVVPLVAKA